LFGYATSIIFVMPICPTNGETAASAMQQFKLALDLERIPWMPSVEKTSADSRD